MFKSLKTLLSSSFKTPNAWKTRLLAEWPEVVGNLHDKMTLEKVYDDTLIIGVYEASWLQELYMLSGVLIKTINEHLGTPHIKKIRFKHATQKAEKRVKKKEKKNTFVPSKITLNSTEAKALLNIKDEEMRTALHLFLSRCKRK